MFVDSHDCVGGLTLIGHCWMCDVLDGGDKDWGVDEG